MLSSVVLNFQSGIAHKYANHGTLIELIWTVTPAFILIAIAFPSFKLLYMIDEVISPSITIKAVGHQWYWSYEYSDFINEEGESIEFDSYMVPETDLEDGQLRLLEVDNRVVVPVDTHIRFIVTGQDVIHDFAVPSLGLKIDCTPGRLNQTSVLIEREGVYYGQCSEICGVYHGFMPIAIECVSPEKYLSWIDSVALSPRSDIIIGIIYYQNNVSCKHDFYLQLLNYIYIEMTGSKFLYKEFYFPLMLQVLYNLLEILIVVVPILLAVAFITIIERKVMGSMQRRIGPNVVGYYGVLQPFADALKLVVKEQVIPTQATKSLFFLAPIISLIFSLLGWGVIPFGPGLALSDFSLGILYSLAVSSIGVYGILFAG